MIKDFFVISFRNINRRKARSFLTIVGIMISITVIFLLASLSLGLNDTVEEQFESLGVDKFFVEPRGQLAGSGSATDSAVNFTEDDVDIVRGVSGVRDATFFVVAGAEIRYRGDVRFTNIGGIEPDKRKLFGEASFLTIDEGRFFEKGETGYAVVGSQYKRNNFFERPVEVGDSILINDVKFRVRGILEPIGSPPDDRIIYVNVEDFRVIFPDKGDSISQIVAQVETGENITLIAERVEKRLRSERDVDEDTQDFNILTPEEILATLGSVLNILTAFLIGIAGISLLVGGIGIANTMYTSVLERTKEIGVMKAVGAKNSDIVTLFTIEAGVLGLIGGGIGVLFGALIAKSIEFVADQFLGFGILQVSLPLYLIVGSLAFSFLIGAVSGLWPAWKGSKVKPVVALRYE